MRISRFLTDDEIVALTDEELEARGEAIGPWRPNRVEPALPAPPAAVTIPLPRDLLAELEAEAALHGQPHERYLKDLLLLALRQVQAGRRRAR